VTTPATIVVGYDGSEPASRALDRAIAEARSSGADLVVVAVAEMLLNPEGPQSFGTLDDTPARMVLVEPADVEGVLAEARKRIEPEGLPADYVWAVGDPAGAIVGTARDRGASLIVVGAHHHGLFGRLLGADVGAEVRREAGCDVLSVE
jgi:nucleotide-binding universal stress UspA family protein